MRIEVLPSIWLSFMSREELFKRVEYLHNLANVLHEASQDVKAEVMQRGYVSEEDEVSLTVIEENFTKVSALHKETVSEIKLRNAKP